MKQTKIGCVHYESLPTMDKFLGWPVKNYATSGAAVLVSQDGREICVLPATGKVTKVGSRIIEWRVTNIGCPFAIQELETPKNLPTEPNTLAVISPRAYQGLVHWNAHCSDDAKIDLSWLLVLGQAVCDEEGHRLNGYYRGVVLTQDVINNRQVVSDELRKNIESRHLSPNF